MSAITAPGFYDVPEIHYHADPAPRPSLSSGVAAILVTGTPAQARWAHPRLNRDLEQPDNRKFDLGSVAHELVTGKGAGIVVVDADDWRGGDAKKQRAAALADGKQPCLAAQFEKATAMRAALLDHLSHDRENRDAFDPAHGEGEVSAFWQDRPTDLWMRARLDWRMTNRPAIYDYKTFAGDRGADPEGFVKHIVAGGKDIQDPHYSTGMAAIVGVPVEDVVFRFVVQEPEPPFLVSVVEFDAQTKEFAAGRYRYALTRWARGMTLGEWPGFAPRTHYAGAPGWAQVQWEHRLLAEEQLAAVEAREATCA